MRDLIHKRIVIVGPGALGCLLAASLSKVDAEVRVLDHDSQRAALLQRSGLTLEQDGSFEHFPVQVTADARQIGPAAVVLLCVKSPDLSQALPSLLPLLTENTLLLAWQNGIGHLPFLLEAGLPGALGLAVTSMGAHLLGPGRVRFGGQGATSIGLLRETSPQAEAALAEAGELFRTAGLEVRVEPDIMVRVWDKLLVNAGINALTAIYDSANGGLLENGEALVMLREAVLEAAAVARAKGIAISSEPVAATIEVCRATATNISSMLQDVRQHRQTEIEAINGAVLREATLLGLPAPVNAKLVAAVKVLEKAYSPE